MALSPAFATSRVVNKLSNNKLLARYYQHSNPYHISPFLVPIHWFWFLNKVTSDYSFLFLLKDVVVSFQTLKFLVHNPEKEKKEKKKN